MRRRNSPKSGIVARLLTGLGLRKLRGEIGLALGGGGARGLAHILMLEMLDELQIRPHRIAGTSIGAVIGAMYASGMSGHEIRNLVDRLTVSGEESWLGNLFKQSGRHWWNFVELQLGSGGLINTDALAVFLEQTMSVSSFSQLQIPLKIVAADLWQHEQVVFDNGELRPAIQASIAIPGLISPLRHGGHVFVDGGLVNPVPYDLLFDECEVVIAIDVSGRRAQVSEEGPGYFETLFNTMQIMESSIMHEKMKLRPPHIYIRPVLGDIRVLDFNRVDEIYARAMPARNELRKALS